MTPEQFVYWLQGYFELCGGDLMVHHTKIIKDHLQEVFTKKTPNYNLDPQRELNPNTLPTQPYYQPNTIC